MIADDKFGVTADIRRILLEDATITEYVGTKVFPIVAPKDTVGDFIFIQRDEYSKERSSMGVATQRCKAFVAIISDDYDRSVTIAQAVNSLLEGEFLDPSITLQLEDSTEDFEDGKFIQLLMFKIL